MKKHWSRHFGRRLYVIHSTALEFGTVRRHTTVYLHTPTGRPIIRLRLETGKNHFELGVTRIAKKERQP